MTTDQLLPPAPSHRRTDPAPGQLLLRADRFEAAAPGIRSLVLRDPDGHRLPSYPPGSHVVLDCGGRRNAYSLTGSGVEPDEYHVSVLLIPGGRGGSAWIHDDLRVGDLVAVSRPRSAFAPVITARHHLLIAGGIGITPMLSHTRAAVARGHSFALLYGHREGVAPHLEELRDLCGDRMEAVDQGPEVLMNRIRTTLREQPLGTHLYVCGPTGLMGAVTAEAEAAGWPDERIHIERFSADDHDPGYPFAARLARSGLTVAVPAGTSLLDALAAAGVTVPNLCRQGVCGECRVGLLAGHPDHRDLYLSPEERATGDSLMCCVSRGHDKLELDL
jgi:ferredoxin-NADP reductase